MKITQEIKCLTKKKVHLDIKVHKILSINNTSIDQKILDKMFKISMFHCVVLCLYSFNMSITITNNA